MRVLTILLITLAPLAAAPKWKALLVDGQNNHRWQETTPLIKKALEDTGLFTVTVATAPARTGDISTFQPDFTAYEVVVSNYNGVTWAEPARLAFEKYMRLGGGLVSVHAADNAFPDWPEFNQMIALGGWGGRNEKSGPYAKYREGKLELDSKPGPGGHHGRRHPFVVTMRDTRHPITQGLPEQWMHAEDELYDSLRGPAKNITLLATAWSDLATGGSGEHEPALFTVQYGKGRIFHTILGDDAVSMRCVGFVVTLQRGAEWAASGKVTQPVPPDFPTAATVSTRPMVARAEAPKLTHAQKMEFLLNAKVVRTRAASKGITGSLRGTLSDGKLEHDAHIQFIDESKMMFQTDRGTELNFRDTWKFNVAGYRLDRMLGLNMTPPSVERKYDGKAAAFTWWLDDQMMDEGDRIKKKKVSPDMDGWNNQMHIVRVFDQLIFNTDRNLGNLQIDSEWRIWMIDHSRAFRLHKTLRDPKNLVKCEKTLLEKMKALDRATLEKEMQSYVTKGEIEGLLGRRDKIVQFFEKKGAAAMYVLPQRPEVY